MPEFSSWLDGIRDPLARQRLVVRLRKASLGNLGDVRHVGGGVQEMREHWGPGWRLYFMQRGPVLVVMLGGGQKSGQQSDIRAAIALAQTLKD